MKSLSELLNEIVSMLQVWRMTRKVRIIETNSFSDTQFILKVRAELFSEEILQVRLYVNEAYTDYAYQLFRGETAIMRWDNKEHFPQISTYPHHFHRETGEVAQSPLRGDVTNDLGLVIEYLERRYAASRRE